MSRHKKLYELICCFVHPVAVVLIWVGLLSHKDMTRGAKLTWGITALIPIVPFFYVLTDHDLW